MANLNQITDPVFILSAASSISSTMISNWNTAFGWGNHALAGYLLSSVAEATYIPLSQKGSSMGVAPLGGDNKIPTEFLPTTGSLYQGTWDAFTNTPTIANGVGTVGWFYRVEIGGTQDLGSGPINFNAGDDVIYNGTIWQRVPSSSAVTSVNGYTGTVILNKSDVGLSNVDNTTDLLKPISTATQNALNLKANASISILAGTGITGGGDLTTNRTISVNFGTVAGTAAQGNDSRIVNGQTAFTWGDHAGLYVPLARVVSASTGLTGGGALSANISLAVSYGTTAGTSAQGNDSRINNGQTAFSWGNHAGLYVPLARTVTASTGLVGGGDLTANRSFAIDPAYSSFTNYYTKTNLQTGGQASVHYGNLTNVPTSFPTSSTLQTVLANGNAATNSITLGASGNTTGYSLQLTRRVSSTDYTSIFSTALTPSTDAAAQINITDGTVNKFLALRHSDNAPTYSPDGGTNRYTVWHSNNHPAGWGANNATFTGASVPALIANNSAGHITNVTSRTLTAGDIGAIANQIASAQTASGWITGSLISNSNFYSNQGHGGGTAVHFGLRSSAGLSRFAIGLEGADAGSNAGHNFNIWRYNDAGGFIGSALSIDRATGNISIAGTMDVNTIPALGSAATNFLTHVGGVINARTSTQVLSDIGAAPISGSGNYIQNISSGAQTANFRVGGYGAILRDGANTLNNQMLLLNTAGTRGINLQLNGDATPGLSMYAHNGTSWIERYRLDATNAIHSFIGNITTTGTATFAAKTLLGGQAGTIGSGTGTSNISYFNFYENNGTTRAGYVGKGSNGNDNTYLVSDNGSIVLGPNGFGDYILERGNLRLVNPTSNRIEFNSVGIGAPTFTTRSAGTKVVLFPTLNASNTDYAIGFEGSALWQSVQNNLAQFKWYAGTTQVAGLSGNGAFTVNNSVTTPTITAPSSTDLNISSPQSIMFNPGGVNKGWWDSDGLGIGMQPNSIRASLLQVAGNIWATDAYILGSGTSPIAEFGLDGGAFIRTMSTQNLDFRRNADTHIMRISGTTGNLLVNSTADNGTDKLQINGSISSTDSKSNTYTAANSFTAGTAVGAGAGRTVITGTTGGGRVEGQSHNGTTWVSGGLTMDAINTTVAGNAIIIGTTFMNNAQYVATRVITATTTALATDHVILCNTTSGNIVLNLPSAVGIDGFMYRIKKSVIANTLTIDPSGTQQIITSSGSVATLLFSDNTQDITLIAQGGNWYQF